MDKKIIFYVFLVLLLDSSYCTPADGKFIYRNLIEVAITVLINRFK